MTPDRWQKVKQIFQSAIQRAPHERSAFLATACGNDDELRREVDSLISAHDKSGEFIDGAAYEAAANLLGDGKSGLPGGQMVGPYEIVSFISRGGMGEVFLAHDRRLNRKIALKLLPVLYTRDDERLRRFEQEARAASALNHPNIITIFEILKTKTTHAIATEFVEGETLRQRLSRSPLALSESLHIAIQVADALAAAHKAGIIHRDIKPENIMLRPDGYVKVLDFGLAKLSEQSLSAEEAVTIQVRTGSGVVMGTAGYMSPEQARGREIDTRSDVFSLGAVIYELVAGRKPFEGETPSDTLAAILKSDPPPIAELAPNAPPELVRIVNKALRKDREERYQVVKDLLIDLRSLKQELEFQAKMGSSHASVAPATPLVTAPQTAAISAQQTITNSVTIELKRHRFAVVTVLSLLVLLCAGAGYGLYRYLRTGPVHFQNIQVTKLTNSGKVISATLSPDGRWVVYALSDARKQSIWIRQVSSANDKEIVPAADVGVFGLTMSHDGNDLYYVVKQNLDKGTLYRIPLLGGTPTRITEWLDSAITFSPDSKQMAFVRGSFPADGESALVIANIDGSNERVLATRKRPEAFSPIFFTAPSWSPDGELIAASVNSVTGQSQVITVQVRDGKESRLALTEPFIARTFWLPDMSGLLAIAGASVPESQVWFVPYPSGAARQITNDLQQHRDIGLSDKADKFVTVLASALVNVWVAPNGDADQATQLPVGNISFNGTGGNSVAWTPDGRIVFASNESMSVDLWVMNADGTQRKQLTSNAGKNIGPVVTADGRYIVFTSTRSGSGAIWRMDIDGRNAKQLSKGDGDWLPALSPDDKWVVYASVGTSKPLIWKVPIDGGTPVQLTAKSASNPVVSPDGKWLAYLYADSYDAFAPANRIGVMPFEGGEETKTFSIPSGTRTLTLLQWASDSKQLLFTTTVNNVTNIWSQRIDGTAAKQVTQFKDGLMNGFAWTADGKNLVCTRGSQLRDAVLITDVGK